uniref:Uncharacterized protein n=1 Tax=Panagrolaimus davidi TaxID=227884 RepID=A0A914PK55_9BILA
MAAKWSGSKTISHIEEHLNHEEKDTVYTLNDISYDLANSTIEEKDGSDDLKDVADEVDDDDDENVDEDIDEELPEAAEKSRIEDTITEDIREMNNDDEGKESEEIVQEEIKEGEEEEKQRIPHRTLNTEKTYIGHKISILIDRKKRPSLRLDSKDLNNNFPMKLTTVYLAIECEGCKGIFHKSYFYRVHVYIYPERKQKFRYQSIEELVTKLHLPYI